MESVLLDQKYEYLRKKHGWHKDKDGYWRCRWRCPCRPRTTMMLHKLVLNLETLPADVCPCDGSYAEQGFHVAHLNDNKDDNRVINLEYQLASYNASSRPIKDTSSQYTGVSKNHGSWRAEIMIDREYKYLGTFKTELEAAKARDQYILDNNLQSRYKLNFP